MLNHILEISPIHRWILSNENIIMILWKTKNVIAWNPNCEVEFSVFIIFAAWSFNLGIHSSVNSGYRHIHISLSDFMGFNKKCHAIRLCWQWRIQVFALIKLL